MRQTHNSLDLLLGAYSRRFDFNSPTGLAGSCRSLCPFPQGPLRQPRGGEHPWQPQQFAGMGKPQCCSRNPPAGSGRRAPCRDKPTIPRDAALSARKEKRGVPLVPWVGRRWPHTQHTARLSRAAGASQGSAVLRAAAENSCPAKCTGICGSGAEFLSAWLLGRGKAEPDLAGKGSARRDGGFQAGRALAVDSGALGESRLCGDRGIAARAGTHSTRRSRAPRLIPQPTRHPGPQETPTGAGGPSARSTARPPAAVRPRAPRPRRSCPRPRTPPKPLRDPRPA